ncbi:hypothetical protein ACPYO6_07670 [Georgenia sp. Z1344]|uniref:hypothetical protein n=1 Tax=Georgenia sp. Z1344 TaxID=3416706 RepID=UPI003CEDD7D4
MSNSYGQDGWGQTPQQGDPSWGQSQQGEYGAQTPYGQSPADPGVPAAPQYGAYADPGQQGQPQYGAYADPGQQGRPPYGAYAPQGQNAQFGQPQYGQQGGAQYGQQAGLPTYPNQDDNPFAAPPAYGMGGHGRPVERPGMLKAACIILWVISGLALLGGFAYLALDPSDVAPAGTYIREDDLRAIGVGVLIGAVLYAFLTVLVWRGSNVGRIILTVLLVLSVLGALANIASGAAAGVVTLLLVVLVLVFLWQKTSSEYIAYRKSTKV